MAATVFAGPGGMPRVNLMPRSEIERRRRRAVLGRWIVALVAAVAVAAVVIAAAFAGTLVATARLAAEQDRSTDLLVEIASLSEVSEAIALESALTTYREQALADDIAWAPVFAALAAAIPEGGALREVTVDASTVPEQLIADPLLSVLPPTDDPATAVGGGVAATIRSPEQLDLITMTRTIRDLPLVNAVEAQELAADDAGDEDEPVFLYRVAVLLNQTVYTERFTQQEGD